jgi:peptide/nickel transport system substrate-binding protein
MIRKVSAFVAILLCSVALASVWAAGQKDAGTQGTQGTTVQAPTKFSEAPILKALVDKGQLPAVAKRLPDNPLVLKPVEEIGQYGGTAVASTTDPQNSLDFGLAGLVGAEPILGISMDYKTIVPNVAESFDFSADKKTMTLHFRKGMKWSDGQPFTANDIMFWWDDVILNDELTPVKPSDWSPGGKLMKMTKVDDYTVRMEFSVSYFPVLYKLSHWAGELTNFYMPAHYMKQFHVKYADKDKMAKMIKDGGFDKWIQVFTAHSAGTSISAQQDSNYPTILAYVYKSRAQGTWVLQRNPYYWKVDTAGNQLPYIDEVHGVLVENVEMENLKVVAGELDFAGINLTAEKYPLYMQNAEKGNYRVILRNTGRISEAGFTLNQTVPDLEKRKIFQDVRFRKALSLAINRDEINKTIFFGKGEPVQVAMSPTTDYFQKEYQQAYAQYDPKQANDLLDQMGLKKGSDGIRLMPSGKKLVMTEEYWPYISFTPISELCKEYWKAIGVQLELKAEERNFWSQRTIASEVDLTVWEIVNSPSMFYNWSNWFVPGIGDQTATPWGNKWHNWYATKGAEGEEPPTMVKNMYKLYEELMATPEDARRIAIGKEFGKLQAENLWVIGTVGFAPQPVVIRKNLRNVPETGIYGWDFLFETVYHPEQYFFKK